MPASRLGTTSWVTWSWARGGEQNRLGARAPFLRAPLQDEGPDGFSLRRAAWFAGAHRHDADTRQMLAKPTDLGGFADAFPALERHETRRRNAGRGFELVGNLVIREVVNVG